MSISAYPLQWPAGWKRTPAASRKRGRFVSKREGDRFKDVSVAEAARRLTFELELMGCPDAVLSTNLELRLDGKPRSDAHAKDPGAAVYWRDGSTTRCMAIDRYDHVAHNIAALAATIEAMRAIERHGGAVILERAFAGFVALPETSSSWRDVLGIETDRPTPEQIERQYKLARSRAHPDKGGSAAMFQAVEHAYAQAMEATKRATN